MESASIFREFVSAINRHDLQAIVGLMAPEHTFIDSLGNVVTGCASMEAGWRDYFCLCPDYWIRSDQVLAEAGLVLACGEAGGTIAGAAWHTPAAWKAEIRDGAITVWQVFADNKPVYDILAERSR